MPCPMRLALTNRLERVETNVVFHRRENGRKHFGSKSSTDVEDQSCTGKLVLPERERSEVALTPLAELSCGQQRWG